MPTSAPRPCTHPGCGALVRGGSRCDKHKVLANSFADRRRGSRHERGYGTAWDKLRKAILARDGGLCQPCMRMGRVTLANIVDHILNKASGGTDDDANLQTICRPCHDVKTAGEGNAGRATSATKYRK